MGLGYRFGPARGCGEVGRKPEFLDDGAADEFAAVADAQAPHTRLDFPEGFLIEDDQDRLLTFCALVRHEVSIAAPPQKNSKKFLRRVYMLSIYQEMKRGAVEKKKSKQVIVWFPLALVEGLDLAVRRSDLDRSKFIRAAVREKVSRLGVTIVLPAPAVVPTPRRLTKLPHAPEISRRAPRPKRRTTLFPGIQLAARALGVHRSHLYRVLKGHFPDHQNLCSRYEAWIAKERTRE
jgi:hypothetical protein